MKYNILLRITHWLMAVCIIGLIVAGYLMTDIPKDGELWGMGKWDVYGLHKSFGVLALALFAFRAILKLTTKSPELPYEIKPMDAILAKLGHFVLYLFMFAVPVSGLIMSMAGGHGVKLFGYALPNFIEKDKELGGIAHELHEYMPYVMAAIIVLHIAAVVKHRLVDKVNLLTRMR